MSEKNSMTRREALKKMGMVAAGIRLGIGGTNATDMLGLSEKEEKREKMKVLAINGNSRKDGNTADMLNLVLGELEKEGYETEHIQLAGHTINPCKACFACVGKKNCVFGNDMFQELYRKMTEADTIILGSSTYSADVSSTLKAVIERASVVSDTNPGMFRHKSGAVAVARRAGAMNTIDTINHFFLNKEMYVAGSTYWNIAYGRLPGEAMKGVANMKNLGQNIAWLLMRIK
ncbi:flavodoxin family protein [Alistipes dispar]|uniref:flavodoxin family protein n=1 Tax=Alistipes dispar TaxID=2585119 RepID=UPI003BF220A3